MKAIVCPFCGIVSDVPHETQNVCIDALRAEIARTRHVLRSVTAPLPPSAPAAVDDDPRGL